MAGSNTRVSIFTPGLFTAPDYYDVLAELRRDAPVYNSEPGTWLVTKYDDIRAISRDTDHFSSEKGVLINDPARKRGKPEGSILHMDPPDHAEYRRIVGREFTPRATGAMDDQITLIVNTVFDALPRGEEIDFVQRVAMPIPVMVIAELLGVSEEHFADFRRWSDAMIEVSDNPSAEAFASAGEFYAFLQELVEERARDPRDDMISMLTSTSLSRAEVVMFAISLLVAGNETTRHLLSGGAHALDEHRDERTKLIDNPDAMAGGVEELLRWVTPIQAFGRTAKTDVVVRDETIGEGDFAIMLYASGNRDEDVFGPTANELDVLRPTTPANVAFGFGEHNCLGAPLARLEARLAFAELLKRFPNYELTEPPVMTSSTLVRGVSEMKVVLK